MKKFLIPAAIISAAAFSSCGNSNEEVAKVQVRGITLKDTCCIIEYKYPATIKGVQDVDIYPQITGRIMKINIKEGQSVKKGEVLFEIDDISYQAAYDAAKAQKDVASSRVEAAKLTLESKQRLYKQNVISEYQFKLAKSELMSAQATYNQAVAAVEKAGNDLSFTRVISPVNGVVGSLPYRAGTLVSQNIQAPLTTISDNSSIYADFSIPEDTYLEISESFHKKRSANDYSMPLNLLMNNGVKYDREGKLYSISGIISKETGAIPIRAIFPNPDNKLLSGGACQVILGIEAENVILIPRTAMKEVQDKLFIFKIVDGKLEQIAVDATRYNERLWILLPDEQGNYPVKAGDKITDTTNRLKNGDEVEEIQ